MSLPSGSSSAEAERLQEEAAEAEVQHLMRQTRLWRVANSAQWVAWGIVQAKVPGMEEALAAAAAKKDAESDTAASTEPTEPSTTERPASPAAPEEAEVTEVDDNEFDYLAFAQDRALFFWADLLSLGLIREDELPAELREPIKARIVNY